MQTQFDVSAEQAVIVPQSRLPGHIQALRRPEPLCRVSKFAFLIFDKTDLDQTQAFLTDFGLVTAKRTDQALRMRGAGTTPFIYIARKAKKSRFVGMVFEVAHLGDLERLRQAGHAQASDIAAGYGGQAIKLIDPAGFEVHVICGMTPVEPMLWQRKEPLPSNQLGAKQRINSALKPLLAPAQVLELSHCVMQVTNFAQMADWYMRYLGLLPSDVQYLPDGSPNLAFFRLDIGTTPTDHHTVVIAGGIKNAYLHSAYEVLDIDAMGQGQQYLRAKGWRHAWGLGRHLIGSQLFDYWFDPDGFELEHMADSDLLDNTIEPGYSPFDRKSLWMWGQDVPAHMAPPKNPLVIGRILLSVIKGQLDVRRLKQIVHNMSQKPRSWIKS